MYRHIFLTGEKQAGKSTIWNRVLEDREYTGFRTVPFYADGDKKGYLLHSLTDLADGRNDCPCVVRIDGKRHAAVLPVFEGAGVLSVRQAMASDTPLILLDEIGKAERTAENFCTAVAECLEDARHHVLGVLQLGDAPLQQLIRDRADTLLLEVTPENREERRGEVEAMLRAWDV